MKPRRPDVTVKLYLVEYGFQMTTRANRRKVTSCHDFAGSYDVAVLRDLFVAMLHSGPFRRQWEDHAAGCRSCAPVEEPSRSI